MPNKRPSVRRRHQQAKRKLPDPRPREALRKPHLLSNWPRPGLAHTQRPRHPRMPQKPAAPTETSITEASTTATTMTEAAAAPAKKAPKAKKPAVNPAHPPCQVMIADALKEKSDSSHKTTLKHMVANSKITDEAKAQVCAKLAARKMVAAKKPPLVMEKDEVAVNESYKHAKKVKKAKKPAAKKAKKAKKPAITKETHPLQSGQQLIYQERWPPKIQQLRKPPDHLSHHHPKGAHRRHPRPHSGQHSVSIPRCSSRQLRPRLRTGECPATDNFSTPADRYRARLKRLPRSLRKPPDPRPRGRGRCRIMIYGISLSNKSSSRHNILYYDLYGNRHNSFRTRVSYYPRTSRTSLANSDLRTCWDMTSRIDTCIRMTCNTDAHGTHNRGNSY